MTQPRQMAVTFTSIRQISQQVGGADEHMTAVLSGTIRPAGGSFTPFTVHVKQITGDVPDSTLEVGPPVGYDGPIDYMAFRAEAQKAYQNAVGRRGRAIRIGGNAHVEMTNNDIGIHHSAVIPMPNAD